MRRRFRSIVQALAEGVLPAALLVFLLALLVYANTLQNGFVFDDRVIIEQNPLIRSAKGIPSLFAAPYWIDEGRSNRLYRPLTTATFALNYLVGGGDPRGFHLTNALLHAGAAVSLLLLLRELFPLRGAALLSALLFALHPIQTEAVASLVGRAEILAAFFLLGALWLDRRGGRRAGWSRSLTLPLSLTCFVLALLSKENALAYPVLLVLGDGLLGRPGGVSRARRWGEFTAAGGLAATYLVLRFRVLGSLMEPAAIPEVDNALAHVTPGTRILTAVALSAKYLGLYLYPGALSVDYSAPQIAPVLRFTDPRGWVGVGVVAAILTLFLLSCRKAPPLAWGIGFAALSFLLVSNIPFPIGTVFAERLLYLPSAGLSGALGVAGAVAAEKRPRTTGALAAGILALCAFRTWDRNRDWKDDFSLFHAAAQVSDRSARVRYNLGNAYRRRGDLIRAAENYRACLELYPAYEPARRNLGVVLVDLGRADEAVTLFREALRNAPGSASLHNNLGNAYRALGRSADAESAYRRAMQLDPASADPHNNLAILLQNRGDSNRAEAEYREAIRLEPGRTSLRVNLGNFLLLRGDPRRAREVFQEAVEEETASAAARRGLGEALMGEGKLEEAERELRRSRSLDPEQWEAPALLGYLHQRRGEALEAIHFYEDSLARRPDQMELHRNLGILYAEIPGERPRALEHLRRCLALNPEERSASEIREMIRALRAPAGSGP